MTGGELAAITVPLSAVASAGFISYAIRQSANAVRGAIADAVACGCKVEAGLTLKITPPPAPRAETPAAAKVPESAEPLSARQSNGSGTDVSGLSLAGVG